MQFDRSRSCAWQPTRCTWRIVPALGWLLAGCMTSAYDGQDASLADLSTAQRAEPAADGCRDDSDCDGIAASCERDSGLCLMRCPSVVVATRADLRAARRCREIDGKLTFRATDVERVSADDLPYLERVSGSIISLGSSPLREITLPALREVGTPGAQNLLEIGFDAATLQRVSLPELRTVHGDMSIAAAGALRELFLPQLTAVDGAFGLINLPQLSALALSDELRASRLIAFEYLCGLPFAALPNTDDLDSEHKSLRSLGCCTESSFECQSSFCHCGS